MVEKGYVASTKEAFDRYLAKGQPAYAERDRISWQDAVEAISAAGGVAALAHPYSLNMDGGKLDRYVEELSRGGLVGLECYYPEHSAGQIRAYERPRKPS